MVKMRKPNIIYILGDDHRADYTAAAGHPIIETPAFDQLAREGVYFENAFCTSPTCTPSRACHYLGQWERKHGVNFNSDSALTENAWEKSFPMILKKNGYFTGWVGKNHVPAGTTGYSSGYFENVFDYWYGNHGHSFFYVKEKKGGRIYSNARADTQVEVFEEGVMNFLAPQRDFLNRCASPLRERPANKPFCLCVTFNLPHDCGTGDMQLRPADGDLYITKYRDRFNDFPLPKTYKSRNSILDPKIPLDVYNGVLIPQYDYIHTQETMREKIVRICQTVTGVDRFLGRLREKLKEIGEDENTIIVFSTDHGIHHGEFGLGGKNLLYEPDIRIPLVIYDPRMDKKYTGKKISSMTAVPDIAPTLMELLGYEKPASMQGESLMPVIRGEKEKVRNELFTEAIMDIQNYPRSESVRGEQFKYIRYFARKEDPAQNHLLYKGTLDDYNTCLNSTLFFGEQPVYEELYDLQNDKYEEKNLAKDPAHSGELDYYRKRILELGTKAREDERNPDTYMNIPGGGL